MEFYRPQRKQTAIPIVSLIDILVILLVYFVVSTQFKKKRDVLDVNLALTQEMQTQKLVQPAAVLSISATGEMSLEATRIPEGFLLDFLKTFRKQNPDRKLEVKPDKNASWQSMVTVWDALTKAGFQVKDVHHHAKVPGSQG